ncbi:MAG: hypothetical protein ABIO55_10530 [Ginsengibacter sp.]
MKFVVSLILIILLSFIACLYFPWWSIAIASFLVAALIPQRTLISFITGFCALFILWMVLTLWISSNNNHILAHKVSLLILKTDSPYLLMLVSALIGAIVAGFAAMAGSYLSKRPVPLKEVQAEELTD